MGSLYLLRPVHLVDGQVVNNDPGWSNIVISDIDRPLVVGATGDRSSGGNDRIGSSHRRPRILLLVDSCLDDEAPVGVDVTTGHIAFKTREVRCACVEVQDGDTIRLERAVRLDENLERAGVPFGAAAPRGGRKVETPPTRERVGGRPTAPATATGEKDEGDEGDQPSNQTVMLQFFSFCSLEHERKSFRSLWLAQNSAHSSWSASDQADGSLGTFTAPSEWVMVLRQLDLPQHPGTATIASLLNPQAEFVNLLELDNYTLFLWKSQPLWGKKFEG